MKFVEDFENDGRRLYDFLLELSNKDDVMYYDIAENNSNGKLLNQLQLNKLMKRNYIEDELIVMLYDKNKNLIIVKLY